MNIQLHINEVSSWSEQSDGGRFLFNEFIRPLNNSPKPIIRLLPDFVVGDIDREYARLQAEGVTIATPLETEPWGEQFFQVIDPNGIVLQLVQWMTDPIPQP
nr:VOC family protein [Chroococcidiopsis sp. CCMEE 29]